MTSLRWGSASDRGRVREGNEDSTLAVAGLFAVADGMGGHRGGETASRLAVDAMRVAFEASGPVGGGRSAASLVRAVEVANEAVMAQARADPELEGMGTTLCALAVVDGEALAAVNVGDSRLYLFQHGGLRQLSEDHSLVATLQRQGRLSPAEAATHPQRNILTRALGIEDRVMVDSWEIAPAPGDRFVLCSDGLFNEVDDARLAAALRRLADPADAAHELVRLANERGGRDNISVVVVDVVDEAAAAAAALVAGAPAGVGAPGAGGGEGGEGGAGRRRRRRRGGRVLTWRVGLFALALVAIVAAAGAAVWWSATSTYYLAFDGDEVVVFQGRPGGVLWIDPSLQERTDLTRQDLSASAANDVGANKSFASLADAQAYLANATTTTTTTTTTSTTTTTTTTAPPPAADQAPPGAGSDPTPAP